MQTNRTNDGIVATAASQTQWLLSQPMLDDLEKDGIDWSQLKAKATTVYVILPAHALETFSVWLRLVVACAFNALYRQGASGRLRTLFMLSEFAQLGKMSMIGAALGQGRGIGAFGSTQATVLGLKALTAYAQEHWDPKLPAIPQQP